MKKILLSVAALTMIIGATLLTSCNPEDTTAPVITLTGDNPLERYIGQAYVESGATANDNEDGDLTSSIVTTGTVNVNLKGTYTVTYTVSDAAGNTASKTRTVNVVNDAENLAGTYNVLDYVPTNTPPDYNYVDNITTSSTVNNRIWVAKFAAYNNAAVWFDVSGTSIDLPTQMVTAAGADRTFSGSGSISGTTITITYSELTNGTTTAGVETYTKQ